MSPESALAPAQAHAEFDEMILLPTSGSGCPFMGLEADGSIMLSEPSPSHRCFAAEKVRMPRLEFQQQYCLGRDHVRCSTYQAAVAQPAAQIIRTEWQPVQKRRNPAWLAVSALVLLALLVAAFDYVRQPWWRGAPGESPASALVQAAATEAPVAAALARDGTPTPPATAPVAATKAADTSRAQTQADGAVALLVPTDTPARIAKVSDPVTNAVANAAAEPPAALTSLTINPLPDEVGWWRDGAQGQYALGDSYLNAGQLDGEALISAMRFSLRDIPRGAPILGGALTLPGLKGDRLNAAAPSLWLVELIGERELGTLGGATFMMVFSAPNSVTLPVLRAGDLSQDGINRLELGVNALRWLEEQRLVDADSITVRIVAQVDGPEDTLFAWDSGRGPKSLGRAPAINLQLGAAPPTPPPVPTEDLVVATFTPAPQNVVTLVVQQATATYVAQSVGTFTPVPLFATPTPYARSLPTAQAIARQLGLPGVVLETPVPANEATATALVEYATAVALTTGTYTPVPAEYVTPVLIVPPLPAGRPEDDERALVAALQGVEVPYNGIIAEWLAATPTPQNVATAAAMSVQATADAAQYGPATATPWSQLVFTPVPPPLPTATPTTPLVQSVTSFTPTPVLAPTATPPSELPADMRNIVLFRSDRFGVDTSGKATTLAYDPASNTAARINADWAMDMAAKQLPVGPDANLVAIVKADSNNLAQIFIRNHTYGTEKQITTFAGKGSDTRSYDPAWSPKGDWIAFVSNNSGNDEIYRISPDGAIVQQLTDNTWEWDKHPTWSPDGSQIVFFSNRDTSRRQLWIMNADGSNQRQLLASDGEDWDPIWTR